MSKCSVASSTAEQMRRGGNCAAAESEEKEAIVDTLRYEI
jgi:hypothetical protein